MQKRMMKTTKTACALALTLTCCLAAGCLPGCSPASTSAVDPALDTADVSGGVAVTVNGVEIGENAVTAYIEELRAARDLEDDEAWGQWLFDNAYTVDSIRGEIINAYVAQELVRQAAEENGVSVSSDEVDEWIQVVKDSGSEEDWETLLSWYGMTDAVYRASIETSLLQQALLEKVTADVVASDDDVLSYIQSQSIQYSGAKRSSHILFSSSDEAVAQEVLEKLQRGELSFEDAVVEYSTDSITVDAGGDVGWSGLNTYVTAYQEALDELGVGEMSGLVESEYGIHIILCTDAFDIPDEGLSSLDQVPDSFLELVRATADESAKQLAFSTYMINYKDEADISKTNLPADVPYYVDLAPYEEAAAQSVSEDSQPDGEAGDVTDEDSGD